MSKQLVSNHFSPKRTDGLPMVEPAAPAAHLRRPHALDALAAPADALNCCGLANARYAKSASRIADAHNRIAL
ncbi:hypothetical protein [Mesorhizobium sp. M8A.F.Ca.ET.181.01.1.1]|uniref:hypothetical protein n=1 Tax=Mesorhizobium sp. M8A.F.Ca.ET.181.01.1.1 TaxID=2563963 RepID=UPI00113E40B2|nr:hypothetical protein [Mesorhizobium sp. M8A.F.Ca.ET.181.01.1.1]TGS81705.1 hypothetical protein EN824_11820 [Mesorhizobium sp. M8A.F.Ca.ET.181.01.1.1]